MHLHLLYQAGIAAFLTGVKNGEPEDMYRAASTASLLP
jgi:hypothetical protein